MNRYDYNIFYNYIKSREIKYKMEKEKKGKNSHKKSKKINISETKDIKTHSNGENSIKNKEKIEDSNTKTSKAFNEIIPFNLFKNENPNNDSDAIESEENKFIIYFKERKQFFSDKGYQTPFLDELINKKIKIDRNIFALKKPKNYKFFEPHYANLEKAIEIFNDPKKFEENVLKEKNYGYICYKILDKDNSFTYREGLYAILQNRILYSEITDKSKFVKDDIYFENDDIADNNFKARSLSLEYYLKDFFMDYFKQKELPRVIYNFDPIIIKEDKIEDTKRDKKKVKKEGNEIKKENERRTIEIEEFDGVFYLEKSEKIFKKNIPFIIDDTVEYFGNSFNFAIENKNDDHLIFDEGTMILLEVKNRFPDNLEKEINIILNKTLNFYQLYEERYKNIEKLRIIFFYDDIPKKNYDKALLKIINNFFIPKAAIREKIQFQFIFITSSYLAFNFRYLKDKIEYLEKTLKENNSKFENEIKELKEKNSKIESKFNDFSLTIKELLKKVEQIELENKNLKIENKLLKNKLSAQNNQYGKYGKNQINEKNGKNKKL